jgi:NTP pyrophosphatase (non-canonical NTP hydrolase)
MSDIKILQRRAMEISRRYDELNKSLDGMAWDTKKLASGFKKDVSDLIEILESKNLNRRQLNHELGDCLWSVLVIAHKLGVDIEKEFWTTMEELEVRLRSAKP